MATQQEIAVTLTAAYQSGWPAPHTFPDKSKAREVYEDELGQIIEWALTHGKVNLVTAVGVVAKDDVHQAMYLLGFKDEPITGAEMLEEIFAAT